MLHVGAEEWNLSGHLAASGGSAADFNARRSSPSSAGGMAAAGLNIRRSSLKDASEDLNNAVADKNRTRPKEVAELLASLEAKDRQIAKLREDAAAASHEATETLSQLRAAVVQKDHQVADLEKVSLKPLRVCLHAKTRQMMELEKQTAALESIQNAASGLKQGPASQLEAARLAIEAKDMRIRELEEQLQGAKAAEQQAEEEAKQSAAEGMTQQQWKEVLHCRDQKIFQLEELLQAARDGPEATIRRKFRRWDKDGDGSIGRSELAGVLKRTLGSSLAESEADCIFRAADSDASGLIDYDEFVRWVFMLGTQGLSSVSCKEPY